MTAAGTRNTHTVRTVPYGGVQSAASIGLSIAAWATSLSAEPGVGLARADRWAIHVGECAPTFFGFVLALSQYEPADGTVQESDIHHLEEKAQEEMAAA